MANNYTSSTDAFADISEGNYESWNFPVMDGFVSSASRLIDLEVGRWDGFFYPSTDNVIKFYDGSGGEEQDVDEFASISEVAISETGGTSSADYIVLASTDWMPYPYNYAANGKPITHLIMDINGGYSRFPRARKSVRVTGIPGYSLSPPAPIALAARIQSVRWFMRAKQGYQDQGASVEMGGLRFTSKLELDPDVKQLLYPYKLELER